jgi:hypothetical protein
MTMTHRVVHVASMARSGETMVLRALAAHPRVHVVHNLARQDSPEETRLFHGLKAHDAPTIPASHPLVAPLSLSPGVVLVLKQGTWEHAAPFAGFVLARNPVAIYASLRAYDARACGGDPDACWHHNTERLVRWLGDIDAGLIPRLVAAPPVEQFCLFYNRRMGALSTLGLPVVHYERLVTDPVSMLPKITALLGLDCPGPVLHAHRGYAPGAEGHGRNDLSRPIDTRSIVSYREQVDEATFDVIAAATAVVASAFGYRLAWGASRIVGDSAAAWVERPDAAVPDAVSA